EGGGRIIEDDGTVSVNNPAAVRGWERARHWIGWISPPSVLAYRESDSAHMFEAGGAAFERVWAGVTITRDGDFRQIYWQAASTGMRVAYARIPGGSHAGRGALGGSGLAVSRRSAHPAQAIELVRYLVRAEIHLDQQGEKSPGVSPNAPSYRIIRRPSAVTGEKYDQVSKLYIASVHAVLSGKRHAPQAAEALEKQLVAITGFHTGPPVAE
ncbi:MAG TPA: extracellular solute-binding protein, partial [Terriglobales bacterium]|nr:extracellular solute-binding protein [Terriglobales bacterium]